MTARALALLLLMGPCGLAQTNFNIIAPGVQSPQPSEAMPSAGPAENPVPAKGQPSEAPKNANPSIGGFEIPVFDPANDSVTWNGQLWQIDNNRVLRARFEKYLNAPATEMQAQAAYDKVVARLMDLLSAGKISNRNLDEAFKLLPQAAGHAEDANLCDAIASQVLGAWQSRRQVARLAAANKALEEDRKRHEWNSRISAQSSSLDNAPKDSVAAAEWAKQRELERTARMQPHAQRLTEVNALLTANRAKSELSALQARIEFQTLLVQLFLQRRFRPERIDGGVDRECRALLLALLLPRPPGD